MLGFSLEGHGVQESAADRVGADWILGMRDLTRGQAHPEKFTVTVFKKMFQKTVFNNWFSELRFQKLVSQELIPWLVSRTQFQELDSQRVTFEADSWEIWFPRLSLGIIAWVLFHPGGLTFW